MSAVSKSPVADFVRGEYSADGVQVESVGDKCIVCSLPVQFEDIGGFTADLEERFGATVDVELRSGNITLVVWTPANTEAHGTAAFVNSWSAPVYTFNAMGVLLGLYFGIARSSDIQKDLGDVRNNVSTLFESARLALGF